ncbi:hypothetical protein O6H91_Y354200 [Diphasiastrum complanatum]|nr:hypothetical protein O6H91_Y354200 [Diphasiastrum complanatum]
MPQTSKSKMIYPKLPTMNVEVCNQFANVFVANTFANLHFNAITFPNDRDDTLQKQQSFLLSKKPAYTPKRTLILAMPLAPISRAFSRTQNCQVVQDHIALGC